MQKKILRLIEQKRLTLESPLISCSKGFIAFVNCAERGPLVLKARRDGIGNEWDALCHFDGRGAVRAVERLTKRIMLIERVDPGHSLAEEADSERRLDIHCDVIRKMHARRAAGRDRWFLMSRLDFSRLTADQRNNVPGGLLDCARSMGRDLAASQTRKTILHGDLHPGNIVYDKDRGWLAIDPFGGFAGELEVEATAVLRMPTPKAPGGSAHAEIGECVSVLSERLSLDRERLLGWAFVGAVYLAAQGSGDNIPRLLALAHTLYDMAPAADRRFTRWSRVPLTYRTALAKTG